MKEKERFHRYRNSIKYRARSLDSSLHGDNVRPKDFKRFIKKNKIPEDRYFDAKTRTIIKL